MKIKIETRPPNYIMSFNERLQQIRKEKGISQKLICVKIGISETLYQRYEYGLTEPTLSKLLLLSDFFDTSLDYLVGRTDVPEINRGKVAGVVEGGLNEN